MDTMRRRLGELALPLLFALLFLVSNVFQNNLASVGGDAVKYNPFVKRWGIPIQLGFVVALAVMYVLWRHSQTPERTDEPSHPLFEVRQRLIDRVLEFAQSQLDTGLYAEARRECKLVERPLRVTTAKDRFLDVSIEPYYQGAQGPLVILGEPGTGKTTLLYELAALLTPRDEIKPIPVVFSLSNWALKEGPLDAWLAGELKRNYGVGATLAKAWVEKEQVLPLLDGLDEVPIAKRAACVQRINEYRTAHLQIKPVLTCREAEYGELDLAVEATSVVVVRTMDRSEVAAYLETNAQKFRSLRRALEIERGLWELLNTPLMLWVGALAFEDHDNLPVNTGTGELRDQLFSRYLERMLKRERGQYDSDRAGVLSMQAAKCWLHQTAVCLERAGVYSFHLEDISLKWLPQTQRSLTFWGMTAITGLVSGLAVGLVAGRGAAALTCGIFSILSGRSVEDAEPVDAMRWSRPPELWGHLTMWLVVGLAVVWPKWQSGLLIGVVGWLILALGNGLVRISVEKRMDVNAGLRKSAFYAVSLGLSLVLAAKVVWGMIPPALESSAFPLVALFVAVLPLWKGGAFCIKNLTVRLALYSGKYIPWRYATFLDFAVERVLMVRQGGSFRFVHRALQEHLAAHPPR